MKTNSESKRLGVRAAWVTAAFAPIAYGTGRFTAGLPIALRFTLAIVVAAAYWVTAGALNTFRQNRKRS